MGHKKRNLIKNTQKQKHMQKNCKKMHVAVCYFYCFFCFEFSVFSFFCEMRGYQRPWHPFVLLVRHWARGVGWATHSLPSELGTVGVFRDPPV